jgi:hypothetical protein
MKIMSEARKTISKANKTEIGAKIRVQQGKL